MIEESCSPPRLHPLDDRNPFVEIALQETKWPGAAERFAAIADADRYFEAPWTGRHPLDKTKAGTREEQASGGTPYFLKQCAVRLLRRFFLEIKLRIVRRQANSIHRPAAPPGGFACVRHGSTRAPRFQKLFGFIDRNEAPAGDHDGLDLAFRNHFIK
jgi:hypothetical protein